MKLYFCPGACSLASHIAARELGLDLDLAMVDLRSHKTSDGEDYYAINPKGYVPALVLDDGEMMTESSVILQFLADRDPEARMIPAHGTMERYRTLQWLSFIGTEIHKAFTPLHHPLTTDEMAAATKARIVENIGALDEQIGDNDYICGSEFSVVDAYGFAIVSGGVNFVKLDISHLKSVGKWLERIASRPQVIKAMQLEGLIPAA